MDLDDQRSMVLTRRDLMLIQAGLKAYLSAFEAHRAEDAGASHPEDQWIALQDQVGQLLWRLEETGAGAGALVQHSPEAVNPDA